MSERKVLTKYYPPDFDPSKITRTKKAPGPPGPKTQTVRLMAPFSMKCTQCGEFIYKGRKFNARKEITDEKYIAITIFRFYIRCTRCAGEITFKTDPKNMDYTCEKGAKRNFEPWRAKEGDGDEHEMETEEERLDRLEAEEAAQGGAMEQLEAKVLDAKREMEIADALDEIRTRNARIQRAEGKNDVDTALEVAEQKRLTAEQEQRRLDEADAEIARQAFANAKAKKRQEFEKEEEGGEGEIIVDDRVNRHDAHGQDTDRTASSATSGQLSEDAGGISYGGNMPHRSSITSSSHVETAPPQFKKTVKKKKDFAAALGIKRKPTLA